MQATPISLYLDLEEGQKADLEVVARASLAFAATIRQVAAILDPSIEVRIEFASGTPGSLSVNSLIRAVRQMAGKRPRLTAIALGVLAFFVDKGGGYTFDLVMDYLRSKDAPEAAKLLSNAEMEEIAAAVVKVVEGDVAKEQRQEVYRELQRDPAIIGVGATLQPGTRPAVVVPRSEFVERAGGVVSKVETIARRTSDQVMPVVLISPVLKPVPRSWKFQYGSLPEFGATMKDQDFLQAMVAGGIPVPLKAGIEMVIVLEIKEELEGEVWVVKERNVVKVLSPSDGRQDSLPLPPP